MDGSIKESDEVEAIAVKLQRQRPARSGTASLAMAMIAAGMFIHDDHGFSGDQQYLRSVGPQPKVYSPEEGQAIARQIAAKRKHKRRKR